MVTWRTVTAPNQSSANQLGNQGLQTILSSLSGLGDRLQQPLKDDEAKQKEKFAQALQLASLNQGQQRIDNQSNQFGETMDFKENQSDIQVNQFEATAKAKVLAAEQGQEWATLNAEQRNKWLVEAATVANTRSVDKQNTQNTFTLGRDKNQNAHALGLQSQRDKAAQSRASFSASKADARQSRADKNALDRALAKARADSVNKGFVGADGKYKPSPKEIWTLENKSKKADDKGDDDKGDHALKAAEARVKNAKGMSSSQAEKMIGMANFVDSTDATPAQKKAFMNSTYVYEAGLIDSEPLSRLDPFLSDIDTPERQAKLFNKFLVEEGGKLNRDKPAIPSKNKYSNAVNKELEQAIANQLIRIGVKIP